MKSIRNVIFGRSGSAEASYCVRSVIGLGLFLATAASADFREDRLKNTLSHEGFAERDLRETISSMNESVPNWKTWTDERALSYARAVGYTPSSARGETARSLLHIPNDDWSFLAQLFNRVYSVLGRESPQPFISAMTVLFMGNHGDHGELRNTVQTSLKAMEFSHYGRKIRTDELGFWIDQFVHLDHECHSTQFIEWLDQYFKFTPSYEFMSAEILDQSCDLFADSGFSSEEWTRRFKRIHEAFPTEKLLSLNKISDHPMLMKFLDSRRLENRKSSLTLPDKFFNSITDKNHPAASFEYLFEVNPTFEEYVMKSWNSSYSDGLRYLRHFAKVARALPPREGLVELNAISKSLKRVLSGLEPMEDEMKTFALMIEDLFEELDDPEGIFSTLGEEALNDWRKFLRQITQQSGG